MDCLGHQLFTRPVFAQNHDGGGGISHAGDFLLHLTHAFATTDHVGEGSPRDLFLELVHFLLQLTPLFFLGLKQLALDLLEFHVAQLKLSDVILQTLDHIPEGLRHIPQFIGAPNRDVGIKFATADESGCSAQGSDRPHQSMGHQNSQPQNQQHATEQRPE